MKISFALIGLVAANNNYNQAHNYNNANQGANYNQGHQANNNNQANNYNQANNAYPSQPGTYGATSYGSTGYGKGLSCWTCDAYSFDDCHKKGKLRQCNANEVCNTFEDKKRMFKFFRIWYLW